MYIYKSSKYLGHSVKNEILDKYGAFLTQLLHCQRLASLAQNPISRESRYQGMLQYLGPW